MTKTFRPATGQTRALDGGAITLQTTVGSLVLTGEAPEFHSYEPFGEPLDGDNDRTRYTDHEYDDKRGLHYMKGRFQLATATKFNRPDPMRDWDWTNPSSINLYQYVRNDPINAYDPTGFGPEEEIKFAMTYPLEASIIGKVTPKNKDSSNNISSVSWRFSRHSGLKRFSSILPPEEKTSGTEVNALRHAIWQAIITVQFGQDVAKAAGDAHENNSLLDKFENTGTIDINANDDPLIKATRADTLIDLLNNSTGRTIGQDMVDKNSKRRSKEIALKVLEEFHRNGLNISMLNKNGEL